MRIWIDIDGVVYDFHTPWISAHNKDHPAHQMTIEDLASWDAHQSCVDNNCPADIYSYFSLRSVWTDGKAIENSIDITKRWVNKGHQLGFVSTLQADVPYAAVYKTEWLKENFGHIKDIIFVNGTLKHYINGDILIDDGIHNLTNPSIIGILYTQPWNRREKRLRADNWNQLDYLINKADTLMNTYGHTHIQTQHILQMEQRVGT